MSTVVGIGISTVTVTVTVFISKVLFLSIAWS